MFLKHSLCSVHSAGWFTLLSVFQRASKDVILCCYSKFERVSVLAAIFMSSWWYLPIFPLGAAIGGSQHTAISPECVPSCPHLNTRMSKTPRGYVTLLYCGRMLNSGSSLGQMLPSSSAEDKLQNSLFREAGNFYQIHYVRFHKTSNLHSCYHLGHFR